MSKIDENGLHMKARNTEFPQKKAILIFVEPEVANQLEKLKAQNDWNTLMKEFLKLREEKLAAELKEIDQKIIPLYKAHHKLAHDGLIENEEKSPNEWLIGKKADIIDYKILIDQRVAEYRRGKAREADQRTTKYQRT